MHLFSVSRMCGDVSAGVEIVLSDLAAGSKLQPTTKIEMHMKESVQSVKEALKSLGAKCVKTKTVLTLIYELL